jgi:hypothetical protein
LSPATIWSIGWVTGNRATSIAGLWKVCGSALVMWVACSAPTMAARMGRAVSSGVTARSQTLGRRKPAYAVAQARQPNAKIPRRPVEPPEATAWNSSNR